MKNYNNFRIRERKPKAFCQYLLFFSINVDFRIHTSTVKVMIYDVNKCYQTKLCFIQRFSSIQINLIIIKNCTYLSHAWVDGFN